MKKITILCLLLGAALQPSCSHDDNGTENPQPVEMCIASGNITLTSQAEVDAFSALEYCSINGGLTIGDDSSNNALSNITSLAALENLTEIRGQLNIIGNPGLTSLEGLHNVKGTASVNISNNSTLQNLNGLRSLENLFDENQNSYSKISNNLSLTNLTGLEKLKQFKQLEIANNPQLTGLDGLDNVTEISNLIIGSCPSLSSINKLGNVTKLNGLQINDTGITSLAPLNNVAGPMTYDLILTNNPSLNSISGLNGVTATRNLTLQNLPSLTSLNGLGNISNVDIEIHISNCQGLTNLVGLGGLLDTNAAIIIEANQNLESLAGLQNLTHTSSLFINGNTALTTIEHLSSLTGIYDINWDPAHEPFPSSTLAISSNASLTSLSGLENVEHTYWIYVTNNPSLQDLCAIHQLMPMPGGSPDSGPVYVSGNLNPVTREDIYNGNCN